MEIGRVIGRVWATKKDEGLNGYKLLVLKMLEEHNKEKPGLIVAVDIIGAGVDDLVIGTKGGPSRFAIDNSQCPIDAAIVGIVDSIEVDS